MAFMLAVLDRSGGSAVCLAPLFWSLKSTQTIAVQGVEDGTGTHRIDGSTGGPMTATAGIDIAKEFHRVAIVIDGTGNIVAAQRIDDDPGNRSPGCTEPRSITASLPSSSS
ncbi:hypothetical protein ACFXPA_05545 [Amycolatopsis sp. NPDC059090]|uniref:hypothetical protein n=1 Tax=unclassified Amycolatopsis TaxID=2618356 RepID=UPI00366CA769